MHSFKYLGTQLNSQNNNNEEIKKRVLAGDRCLHAQVPVFKVTIKEIKTETL